MAENYDREDEIWLVYYKKTTGKPSIPYGASVEEALCYGWVDSLIKKLDEERYVRKFTPRRQGSNWSQSNIQRVESLIEQGLMAPPGMRLVEDARRTGNWEQPETRPELEFKMPPEFQQALDSNPEAKETFDKLSNTYKKQYLGWIEIARRQATRERRIAESIRLLERGDKLGLK